MASRASVTRSSYAQEAGATEELADSIRLAVSEAITNVVVHAYIDRDGGDALVEAWCDEDEHLVIVVCDEGVGLVPRPSESPGMGMGIGLRNSEGRNPHRDGESAVHGELRAATAPAG